MPIIVSDAAAEETLQAYTNPLSIQAKALDDLSDKVLNGAIVSDGNNPFTFLTEFASNMTANIVNKACECFNGLYPLNAQTATELYRHLSDFDYVGLYATPATTTVELIFDRNFLINNAVDATEDTKFNGDSSKTSGVYSKIIIPAYSKFMIGDYSFGLMYPIEIRVRKAITDGKIDYGNSSITVNWDATNINPLMPLTSYILEHRDFIQDGQMLTAIAVPIYQFEVENNLENSIGATGFAKRYDYANKFYAVRVFHFKNGEWNEMAQTFSDTKYDPDVPTAIIKVLTDIGKVEVVIPHVYFNSKDAVSVIGNRILVKIYTTLGEVNVDLSEYKVEQFTASFLLNDANLVEDDRYSNMLKRIPTVYILPINTKIMSGTNGITFDQLKDRVKYNSSYTVKITPNDLQNYFNTSGFKFTKELDNITDRVYCAHKLLTDGLGTPIASGQGTTYLTASALSIHDDGDGKLYVPGYSTITVADDNTITILPSSMYRYNEKEDRFYLLSDAEILELNDPNIKTRVANYNGNLYTYSPFHTVLSTEAASPIAGTYDMFKPSIKDRLHVWENERTSVGLSVYNATISSTDDGYVLRVSVFKTANINSVPARNDKSTYDNFMLILTTEGKGNMQYYLIGKYAGSDTSDKDVFDFNLTSDFKISLDGEVFINTFRDGMEMASEDAHGGYVDMDFHEYTISLCIHKDVLANYVGSTFSNSNTVDFGLPAEANDYVLLCQQSFKLKLGEALPLINNNVTISTTDEQYLTYPTTQFATYQTTVYERYTVQDVIDGICPPEKVGELKLEQYTTTDGETKQRLIVHHKPGDVILSSQSEVVYGPTITLTLGDSIDTLELMHDDVKKITATSDPSNEFGSIDGDVFVQSKHYPTITGVYKLVDRNATGTRRAWENKYNSFAELFDTTIISTPQIYRYNYEDDFELTFVRRRGTTITINVFDPLETGYSGDYSSMFNFMNLTAPADGNIGIITKEETDRYVNAFLDLNFAFHKTTFLTRNSANQFDYIVTSEDRHYDEVVSFIRRCINVAKCMANTFNPTKGFQNGMPYYSDDYLNALNFMNKYYTIARIIRKKKFPFTDEQQATLQVEYNQMSAQSFYTNTRWKELVDAGVRYGNNDGVAEYNEHWHWDIYHEWFVTWANNSDPVIPAPENEPPATSGVMTFVSSNNWRVKNKLQALANQGKTPIIAINTEARDYDRKWYLLGTESDDFDFENNTGFVIEYGYSGLNISGAVESWVLNYYYYELNNDGEKERQCKTVAENLDISDLDWTVLESNGTVSDKTLTKLLTEDPYVNGYVTLTNRIEYRIDANSVAWLYLNELYTARCVIDTGNNSAITRYHPWDVIWQPTDTTVKEIPSVTCMYNMNTTHHMYIEDALKFIDEHIAPATYGAMKLYRNVYNIGENGNTTYALLEDPLKDYMFVAIGECNDSRKVSQFNYIDYAPGYGDSSGDGLVEVGTTTTPGAIYYRDIAMTNYDYTKDGLTRNDVARIGALWLSDEYKDYTDARKYDEIISACNNGKNKVSVPLTYALLRKIVSSSDPSYLSPWVKLITCSSRSALTDYVENNPPERIRSEMSPYDDSDNDLFVPHYSGYIAVLEETDPNSNTEPKITHINFLSIIPKTIEQVDNPRDEIAFYVNPNNLSWNEIDKWPWEYTTPWINIETVKEEEFGVNYNTAISCTKVLYGPDTVKVDENGDPIVAVPRALTYGVDMIHCDYKPRLAEAVEYSSYMNDIRDLLRSYFSELETITPSLLARTKLYFSPIRTFGYAEFKGSNGSIQTLPVQFSAELGLHIEAYVKDSTLSKQTIREVILKLIDEEMKDGIINLAELAKTIVKELGDNVLYVDVLGLNGIESQQTMIPVNEDTYPQLKQILVLYDDGTIHIDRALELDWYVIK